MTPQERRCAIAVRALDTLPTPLLDEVRADVGDWRRWSVALGRNMATGEEMLFDWLTSTAWPGHFATDYSLGDVLERLAQSGDRDGVDIWYQVARDLYEVSLAEALERAA